MTRLIAFLRSSVRGRLACLVLAITGPALLLVGLLVAQAYHNERKAVSQQLVGTARAIAALVDHEAKRAEAVLRALLASVEPTERSIASFDTHARQAVTTADRWIVLTDEHGQQLVNTRVSPGSRLPRQAFDGELRETLQQGRTYISNVIVGALSQRHVLVVAVPVMQKGALKYTLSMVMLPEAFATSLDLARLSPHVVAAVVDREGTIAVRHPNGERFVGQKAMPDIVAATTTKAEGTHESVTLEGARVLAAHSRGPLSGWSVALGAPYETLYASAQRLLWLGLVASGILMAIAIFMAAWIARAVVRSMDALVADTETIGRGFIPAERSSGLAETDFVAHAMHKTARRLHERERDNASLTAALQAELEKQKRAEEASRLLASIVACSEDAIISKNLNGIVTSWNKGAERIFGYLADEMIGHSITRIIPADRQAEEPEILARILRGERIEHFETVRRAKDGRLIPISLTISPLLDRAGNVVGASKISRDITARKRAEAQQQALYELAASVNRAAALADIYDAALNAMIRCQDADRAGILLRDPDGVMRFKANRGLSASYCRGVEGHSPWQPTDPDPQPLWIDDVAKATLAPELRETIEAERIQALAFIPLTYEKRLLGKFMLYYNAPHRFTLAELRPVEAIASQVAFAIERQKGAAALEALVHERTSSLRQAVAQMEEFSYSVSHDLRAPVRAMSGFAEAILQDHAHGLSEEGRQLLARITRNGARMDRLIQDLLTYSRISRREINLEPVSLDKLIGEVVQQYPDLRPERADIEVASPLPAVMAHEPSLTQVLSNLLSNAVKFVPPQSRPRVRIGCERTPTQVRLWVQDNGIGIKPEYHSRLFAMFERLHPEKNYEGTGIGLAIVRKAIERMNGSVGVESDGVSGSKFWIELPIASAQAAAPDEAA